MMETIVRAEKETRKFRLLTLLFVVAGFGIQGEQAPAVPSIALGAGYLLYTLSFQIAIVQRIRLRYVPYIMLVADAAFVTGALSIFGVGSAFFILLPIHVIYYAIYLGYVGSFASATLMSLAYVSLANIQDISGDLRNYVAVQVPLFYLVAFFVGHISAQRMREERERLDLAQVLKAERGARDLLELSRSLGGVLDPAALLKQVGVLACQASGFPMYLIHTYDRERQAMAAVAGNLPLPDGDSTLDPLPAEEGAALAAALQTGQPLLLSNPKASELPAWCRGLAPGRFAAAPLVADEGVLGVIYLIDGKAGPVTDEERGIIKGIAATAIVLLGESQAYSRTKARSEELASELESTIQRMARIQQLQKKADVTVGQLRLEPAREAATLAGGRLSLSSHEFDILYALALRSDPVSSEKLVKEVWGDDFQGKSTVVDVTVHRLRRKLAEHAKGEQIILTKRGAGYALNREAAVLRMG